MQEGASTKHNSRDRFHASQPTAEGSASDTRRLGVTQATQEIVKTEKPRPDFPLFTHATKRWTKKILGQLHYFGPWDNPQAGSTRTWRERPSL